MPSKELPPPPEGTAYLELDFGKLDYIWNKLSNIPGLFNDFERGNKNVFYSKVSSPNTVWLERLDGNGLLYMTGIIPHLSGAAHLVYWDRKLKGREEFTMNCLRWIMTQCDLKKVNVWLPDYAKIVHKFVRRMGFKQEGRLRRWSLSHGRAYDTYVFGMTYEEAFNGIGLHATRNEDISAGESGVREGHHEVDREPTTGPSPTEGDPGDSSNGGSPGGRPGPRGTVRQADVGVLRGDDADRGQGGDGSSPGVDAGTGGHQQAEDLERRDESGSIRVLVSSKSRAGGDERSGPEGRDSDEPDATGRHK